MATNFQDIVVERPVERVGLVRLNRPQALNALRGQLMEELITALQDFDRDSEIGAIVITGSEKAFSAGADIGRFPSLLGNAPIAVSAFATVLGSAATDDTLTLLDTDAAVRVSGVETVLGQTGGSDVLTLLHAEAVSVSDIESVVGSAQAGDTVTLFDATALHELTDAFKAIVREQTGNDFPQDPVAQLYGAIGAVFASWNTERAINYRRENHISNDLGTAVNVQAMVYGNMGDDCATGVAFTRDPATGEKRLMGEYLAKRHEQRETVRAVASVLAMPFVSFSHVPGSPPDFER